MRSRLLNLNVKMSVTQKCYKNSTCGIRRITREAKECPPLPQLNVVVVDENWGTGPGETTKFRKAKQLSFWCRCLCWLILTLRILYYWFTNYSPTNYWSNDYYIHKLSVLIVPDPGKGVCAALWIGAPSWRGDRVPQAGTKSASWAQIREEERRDKMRRRQEVKEDYPFMASRCEHAQSKLTCIAQEETCECVSDIVFVVLIVFIVSGK